MLTEKAKQYRPKLVQVLNEVGRVIVGQEETLQKLLIAMMAQGHVLLEGVPGLAKTLMVKTISQTITATYHRIQFTPDLLPADIVGTKIYEVQKGTFTTKKGPLFANFILADEINRAPPKVQSALLEAMQELQVTISGDTFFLERPFLVLATQNPIETEGTYRLPEAQLDRFTFKLLVTYPAREDSRQIIDRMTTPSRIVTAKVLSPKELLRIQDFVRTVYVDETIMDYVSRLVDATRNPKAYHLKTAHYVELGASPRALIWLILCAKAKAVMEGRGYVLPEDITFVARDVLRHRVLVTYEAEADHVTSDDIIDELLSQVKAP